MDILWLSSGFHCFRDYCDYQPYTSRIHSRPGNAPGFQQATINVIRLINLPGCDRSYYPLYTCPYMLAKLLAAGLKYKHLV